MSQLNPKFDFLSYDEQDIGYLSTALSDTKFLLKFLLGIGLQIIGFIFSIGLILLYLYSIIMFIFFVFYSIIAVFKKKMLSEENIKKMRFDPLGDEDKISNIAYFAFILLTSITFLLNIQFTYRPQLLDDFGFYFVQLLYIVYSISFFLIGKHILDNHKIEVSYYQKKSENKDVIKKNVFLLDEKKAMALWNGFGILIFAFLGVSVVSFIIHTTGSAGDSFLFFRYHSHIIISDDYVYIYLDYISIISLIGVPLYGIAFIASSSSLISSLKAITITNDSNSDENKKHNKIIQQSLEILSDSK